MRLLLGTRTSCSGSSKAHGLTAFATSDRRFAAYDVSLIDAG